MAQCTAKDWGVLAVENHDYDWADVRIKRMIPRGFASPSPKQVVHRHIGPGELVTFRLTPGDYIVQNRNLEKRKVRVYDHGRQSLVMLTGLPR